MLVVYPEKTKVIWTLCHTVSIEITNYKLSWVIVLSEFFGVIETVNIVKISKLNGRTISSSLPDKGTTGAEKVYMA